MKLEIFRDGGFDLEIGLFKVQAVAAVRNDKPFFKHGWFDIGWGEDTLLGLGRR